MSNHLNPNDAKAYTRRAFLQHSTLFASAAMTVPAFLQSSAFALPRPMLGLSSIAGVDEDRVLVVIQMSGGNDGLNTLVPVGDDAYHRVRSRIALSANEVLMFERNGGLGLHGSMSGFKDLYDEGMCAIVQGVGYPNPNRSHFASMDIWHTADTNGTGDGWLGKYVDSQCCGYGSGTPGAKQQSTPADPPPPMVAIGKESPLALHGRTMMPVAIEDADMYQWTGDKMGGDLSDAYHQAVKANEAQSQGADDNKSFLVRTAMDAQVSSKKIRKAVDAQSLVKYPNTKLASQLSMVGSMIRAGMPTRVFYVSHGSFDTHANQGGAQGSHARLLQQLSDAVGAFYKDLKAQGNEKRVMSMCFSEFGRRVSQNGSGGTDHGTAAPMFLFGPMVKPGLHSRYPSLTDLDAGDLKYTADFRQVYAEILDEWLSAKSSDVLGRAYQPLRVLRS
ncbi:MAG: DUF1501 domain-containing protein [Phycisphaerales bacterium]|nr:DUF1501 domain-containing protein [Phycisphaerales bacterium]